MLRLSDSEMTILLDAARPLAVENRDPFLQAVAERLAGMPERGDGQTFRICRELQRKFWDPPIHEPARTYARSSGRDRSAAFVRRGYKEHALNEACANENYSEKGDGDCFK